MIIDPVKPLPQQPWKETLGAIDEFRSDLTRLATRLRGELSPGDTIKVSGWMLDPKQRTELPYGWLVAEDQVIAYLLFEHERPDVSQAIQSTRALRCGFRTSFTLDLAPGTYDIKLVGQTESGHGVYLGRTVPVRVVTPPLDAAPAHHDVAGAKTPSITVDVIRDTHPAHITHGRGPFTIRAEASLRVRGSVLCESTICDLRAYAQICGAGEERWYELSLRPAPQANSTVSRFFFDDALAVSDLDFGAYDITIYVGAADRLVPALSFTVEVARPHFPLPEALRQLKGSVDASIERFESAAPHPPRAPRMREQIRRGDPIVVAGRYADPITGAPPLAVFAALDDHRPIPLSVPKGGKMRGTFSGIIDTARLDEGRHSVDIRAVDATGTGWYLVERRSIVVTGDPSFSRR